MQTSFEHDGDRGILSLVTHFNIKYEIVCQKESGQIFRLGGTAINDTMQFEGLLLNKDSLQFRAFESAPPHNYFEGTGILSPENWDGDRHCWLTEHYPLDAEGSQPSWLISRNPIYNSNMIYVNVDIIDGGDNIVTRYRICPFFGNVRVIENAIY